MLLQVSWELWKVGVVRTLLARAEGPGGLEGWRQWGCVERRRETSGQQGLGITVNVSFYQCCPGHTKRLLWLITPRKAADGSTEQSSRNPAWAGPAVLTRGSLLYSPLFSCGSLLALCLLSLPPLLPPCFSCLPDTPVFSRLFWKCLCLTKLAYLWGSPLDSYHGLPLRLLRIKILQLENMSLSPSPRVEYCLTLDKLNPAHFSVPYVNSSHCLESSQELHRCLPWKSMDMCRSCVCCHWSHIGSFSLLPLEITTNIFFLASLDPKFTSWLINIFFMTCISHVIS